MKKIFLFLFPFLCLGSQFEIYVNPTLKYDLKEEKILVNRNYGIKIEHKNLKLDAINKSTLLNDFENKLYLSSKKLRDAEMDEISRQLTKYDGFVIKPSITYDIMKKQNGNDLHSLKIMGEIGISKKYEEAEIKTMYDYENEKNTNLLEIGIGQKYLDSIDVIFYINDNFNHKINENLSLDFSTKNKLKYDKYDKFQISNESDIYLKTNIYGIDTNFGLGYKLNNFWKESKMQTDITGYIYTEMYQNKDIKNMSIRYGNKILLFTQFNEKVASTKKANFGLYLSPEANMKYLLNDSLSLNLMMKSEYILDYINFSSMENFAKSFTDLNLSLKGGITYTFK